MSKRSRRQRRDAARAAAARPTPPSASPLPHQAAGAAGAGWRADAWTNVLTGVGDGLGPHATATSRLGFTFGFEARLDDATLEALYWGDPYAAKVVKVVPEEALRQGYRLTCDDAALADAIAEQCDRFGVRTRLLEAWIWGRLYGGGGILLGVDDGRDAAEPLDEANIADVLYVVTLDKRELWPIEWYQEPRRPNFGEPKLYQLTRAAGISVDSRPIHATRIIRFDGALTNRRRRAQGAGWSESELQRVYSTLQQFHGAFAATSAVLHDASQAVFAMKDLWMKVSADATGEVKTRLALMDLARSAAKAVLIDADGERFERVESGVLGGFADVLNHYLSLLAGAAEIPVTVLMGQAPAGLNATGDSDVRLFYDRVKSAQENYLRPKLLRLLRILTRAKSGPTKGAGLPEGFGLTFPPLYQTSPQQEAEIRNKQAATDQIYLDKAVVTPEEVALSRFGRNGWSIETQIDLDVRARALAADREAPADDPASAHTDADDDAITRALDAVAARRVPRATGLRMLVRAGLSDADADALMGEIGTTHFTTPEPQHAAELAAARESAAAAARSQRGAQQYLARALRLAKERGVDLGNVLAGLDAPRDDDRAPEDPPPDADVAPAKALSDRSLRGGVTGLHGPAQSRMDMIEKRGARWVVLSEAGDVLGTHDTRDEAEKQLAAIESSKAES